MPCEDAQLIRAANGSLLRDSQGRLVHQNAAAEPCCGEVLDGCGIGTPICTGDVPRFLRVTPSLPGSPCESCFHNVGAGRKYVGHYGWNNTQSLQPIQDPSGKWPCLWQITGVIDFRQLSYEIQWCQGAFTEVIVQGNLFVAIEKSVAFPGRFVVSVFGAMQSRNWNGVLDNVESCEVVFAGISVPVLAGNGQGNNNCGQFDTPKAWYYSGTGPVTGTVFIVAQ